MALQFILATSLGSQPSTEKVFEELLARHQEIESYFAVYEGAAPGGKTVKAAISFHGPAQMASVHTQFAIDGEVVAAPLQAITPELGIVMSGQDALQLKDATLILGPLARIAKLLFESKKQPLGTWSPALSMTKETMAAQLSITSQPQMPWLHKELPAGTTHVVDGKFTIFTTPDGCVSQVQNATGILERQNFPNDQGDRTLVLKELQTNLSPDEISTFISGYLPANLEVRSLGSHPLLANLQHQMLTELVASVDAGHSSYEKVSTMTPQLKPLLHEYFNAIYPPDFWKKTGKPNSYREMQAEEIQKFVKEQWQTNGLKPEALKPKTKDGRMVADLLTTILKNEFFVFLENKATPPSQHGTAKN